jgi:multidrug resistance efflux pump
MPDDNLINFQRVQIAQLHTNAATAVSNAAMSGIAASHANHNLQNIQEQVQALQSQVEFYEALLAQPLHVIASRNKNFKKNYEVQQELLADWMVSQKSFKELAIQLGLKIGMKKEDVILQGQKGQLSVLSGANDPAHNTSADNSSFIKPYIEKLRDKLKNN